MHWAFYAGLTPLLSGTHRHNREAGKWNGGCGTKRGQGSPLGARGWQVPGQPGISQPEVPLPPQIPLQQCSGRGTLESAWVYLRNTALRAQCFNININMDLNLDLDCCLDFCLDCYLPRLSVASRPISFIYSICSPGVVRILNPPLTIWTCESRFRIYVHLYRIHRQ